MCIRDRQGTVRRKINFVIILRADKGIGLNFIAAHAEHRADCLAADLLLWGQMALRSTANRGDRDLIVTIETCNFLGTIGYGFNVNAERRRGNVVQMCIRDRSKGAPTHQALRNIMLIME